MHLFWVSHHDSVYILIDIYQCFVGPNIIFTRYLPTGPNPFRSTRYRAFNGIFALTIIAHCCESSYQIMPAIRSTDDNYQRNYLILLPRVEVHYRASFAVRFELHLLGPQQHVVRAPIIQFVFAFAQQHPKTFLRQGQYIRFVSPSQPVAHHLQPKSNVLLIIGHKPYEPIWIALLQLSVIFSKSSIFLFPLTRCWHNVLLIKSLFSSPVRSKELIITQHKTCTSFSHSRHPTSTKSTTMPTISIRQKTIFA